MNKPKRRPVRRTPKVFNSAYAPPRQIDWAAYRNLWPLAAILLAVVGFYALGKLPALRVQTVEVSGTPDAALVKELNKLKGDSLLSRALQVKVVAIKDRLPHVGELACRRGIPGTLKCTASLRNTVIYWRLAGKTYAVDTNGFIFAQSTPAKNAVVVEDKTTAELHLGKTVASSLTITKFVDLANALKQNHLTFDHFYVSDTLFQCGVILTSSTDPSIPFASKSPISVLFSFDQPIDGQIATLVQLLKEKGAQINDHIDLRVAGTAYIQ